MSSLERKFFHSINNHLAVASGKAKNIKRKMMKEPPTITFEDLPPILNDIIEALDKIEDLVRTESIKFK